MGTELIGVPVEAFITFNVRFPSAQIMHVVEGLDAGPRVDDRTKNAIDAIITVLTNATTSTLRGGKVLRGCWSMLIPANNGRS